MILLTTITTKQNKYLVPYCKMVQSYYLGQSLFITNHCY